MFPSLRYTANDVAAFIIEECNKRDLEISHKKLQKLLYFAQGWYLALTKQSIFEEDIEAWAHGPVIPSVYKVYRNSGWQHILFPYNGNSVHIDQKTRYYLQSVLDIYGNRSADELEQVTHTEEPWRDARADVLPHQKAQTIISQDSMFQFFSRLKRHGQQGKTA